MSHPKTCRPIGSRSSTESPHGALWSDTRCNAARRERWLHDGAGRHASMHSRQFRTRPPPAHRPTKRRRKFQRRHDHAQEKHEPDSSWMRLVFLRANQARVFRCTRSTTGPYPRRARFKWLRKFYVQRTLSASSFRQAHRDSRRSGIARDPSTRSVLRCNFFRHRWSKETKCCN